MKNGDTGRLTRTEPDMQNIPIRTLEGAALRDAFRKPAVDVDYTSIETRLANLFKKTRRSR